MKKHIVILFAPLVFLLNSCFTDYTSTDYLKTVLGNLEEIESATYNMTTETWLPGDTSASAIYFSIVKEYNNPSDTAIGAKYVKLNKEDPTKPEFCYDGIMRAVFYSDEKRIVLDSFKINPLPFRPLNPPFFNYVKSILRYSLESNDSISLDIKDLKDSVYIKLMIYEKNVVEFFGKAFHMPPNPYSFGDNTSRYELWINKTNNLPYKVRREMSNGTVVRICQDFELNKLDIDQFSASDYFPEDYSIEQYRTKGSIRKAHELTGKKAPDWTLQTADKQPISLTDLKSKVLMIQFTSVTCGPCKASIPFLKELSLNYKKEDFDFVAIESTAKNTNVLKTYMNQNKFNYKYLLSTKDVKTDYSISSFPVFFILDENRIIKHVLYGYRKGTTDKEIINLVNDHI